MIYEKIDEFIMYGVNKAVHAWNWITGGTKADLANILSTIGAVTGSTGFVLDGMVDGRPYSMAGFPLLILISHVLQQVNSKVETLESRALEKEAKDFEVEKDKIQYEKAGYALPCMAAGFQFMGDASEDSYSPLPLVNIALLLTGASCHVMRADYLPPRKNALSRAKDSLVDVVKSYSKKPAPVESR